MTSFLGFILPGGPELWIVLAIFLLLFGHRIPSMARSMGSGIVEFKRGLKGTDESDGDGTTSVGSGSSGEKTDGEGHDSHQESGSSNG